MPKMRCFFKKRKQTIAERWRIHPLKDLLHLIENAFDPALTLTLTLKCNNVSGLTKFFDQVYRYTP